VGDDSAGARATTVGLCKNGTTTTMTTTTTMKLAPLDQASSAAADHAAASPAVLSPSSTTAPAQDKKILYGLDDCPAWYLCIFLGLQVSIRQVLLIF